MLTVLRHAFFAAVLVLTGIQLRTLFFGEFANSTRSMLTVAVHGDEIFNDVELQDKKKRLQQEIMAQDFGVTIVVTKTHDQGGGTEESKTPRDERQMAPMYPLRDLSKYIISHNVDDGLQTFRAIELPHDAGVETKFKMEVAGCFNFKCDKDETRCNNQLPTNYDGPNPPCCTHIMRDMVRVFDEEMSRIGVEYQVGYGTLLGLIRDDMIIPWTADNDITVPSTAAATAMATLWDSNRTGLAHMCHNMNRLCATSSFAEGKLKSNWGIGGHITRDLWNMRTPFIKVAIGRTIESKGLYQEYNPNCLHLHHNVFPTKRAFVYNGTFTVNIPANPERVLRSYYGEDWRTPDDTKSPDGGNVDCKYNVEAIEEESKGLLSGFPIAPKPKRIPKRKPTYTAVVKAKPRKKGPIDLKETPGIVFTSCCWCEFPFFPECTNSDIANMTGYLHERGVDVRWIPMPCTKETKRPEFPLPTNPQFLEYSAELQAAHSQGDIIITPRSLRITGGCAKRNCCLKHEIANHYVELALNGFNKSHAYEALKLQNKRSLHQVLVDVGMSDMTPTIYSEQEIKEGDLDYPVMVKRTDSLYGNGISFAHNETELRMKVDNETRDLIVEEALLGDKAQVIHYMSRPIAPGVNGKIVSFWCGYYGHPNWTDSGGMFVLGRLDTYPHALQRMECNPKYTDAMRRVLQHTNLYQNIGCIDGKDKDGPGTLKIHDWNARMCGSQSASIMSDLILGLNTVGYTGEKIR